MNRQLLKEAVLCSSVMHHIHFSETIQSSAVDLTDGSHHLTAYFVCSIHFYIFYCVYFITFLHSEIYCNSLGRLFSQKLQTSILKLSRISTSSILLKTSKLFWNNCRFLDVVICYPFYRTVNYRCNYFCILDLHAACNIEIDICFTPHSECQVGFSEHVVTCECVQGYMAVDGGCSGTFT